VEAPHQLLQPTPTEHVTAHHHVPLSPSLMETSSPDADY
jgi:hypothetical protein